MDNYSVRKATPEDVGRLMEIFRYAQSFMASVGNPNQWGTTYPTEEIILEDIARGYTYVVCCREQIVGTFVLMSDPDPYYARIDGGAWLNDRPYIAIHRIAGDGTVHGLFHIAFEYAKQFTDDIRVDTHEDNKIMQKLMVEHGFTECGVIYVRDQSPRKAYHWVR